MHVKIVNTRHAIDISRTGCIRVGCIIAKDAERSYALVSRVAHGRVVQLATDTICSDVLGFGKTGVELVSRQGIVVSDTIRAASRL